MTLTIELEAYLRNTCEGVAESSSLTSSWSSYKASSRAAPAEKGMSRYQKPLVSSVIDSRLLCRPVGSRVTTILDFRDLYIPPTLLYLTKLQKVVTNLVVTLCAYRVRQTSSFRPQERGVSITHSLSLYFYYSSLRDFNA